jgi:S-adenosylmethionine hydrolase
MIITLLTDFGPSDSYVAETKAALLAGAPDATLIDITHTLAPGDVRAAQYLLGRTWKRFPTGTVHLVVVDPGVGSERRGLAAAAREHFFVGPDNGVLTPVLTDAATVVSLSVPEGAAPTFHGRDVFAPAAARLATGAPLRSLGTAIADPVLLRRPAPNVQGGVAAGEVIYIDRFGTLVTNISSETLAKTARVTLGGDRYEAKIGRTFAGVEPGDLVAYAGSNGEVEIAARDRSAAQLTGLTVGAEVRMQKERTGQTP